MLASGASAFVLVIAGAAIATAVSEDGPEERPSRPFSSYSPAAIERAAVAFSALDGQGSKPRALGDDLAQKVSSLSPGGGSRQAYLIAHRLGFSYHIVTTPDEVCQFVTFDAGGGGGGCGWPLDPLVRGEVGPSITGTSEGAFVITAFVPDGTSKVALSWADGSSQPIPVQDNLIAARVKALPKALSWTAPDGTAQSFPLRSIVGDD